MSDTIQARHHYTTRHAALLQQRPSDLIAAVENGADDLEEAYARAVHVLLGQGLLQGVNANIVGVGNAARGIVPTVIAGTKVMLASTSRPTTAPELLGDLYEYQMENSWTRWAGQANEALHSAASTAHRQTTAAARLRVERLSSLQAAFGFTIQDLATVLGITRPQLYKWLDAANDIKLQETSRARLLKVERIAKEWSSRSNAPLSSVSKEPLTAGGSVFALMSIDVIDDDVVISMFDELMDKLHERPKSRSQRLREAGFARRPSVRSLPSDE